MSNMAQMGLINYNLQPKPAFFAVRNMMHIMCDTNKPFASTNLNYTLSGNMTDVQAYLYQKTNRAYYLPIWLEKQSMQKSGPIDNGSQAVKLQFANSLKWSDCTGLQMRADPSPTATSRGKRSTTCPALISRSTMT